MKKDDGERSVLDAVEELQEYHFLRELNVRVEGIEPSLLDGEEERYPNVFLLGLPRSGTTLLSQVLFNHLDLACTNNLVARFWRAPLTGCYLSRLILGDSRAADYRSEYARTSYIASPHEFSWFWHDRLLTREVFRTDYDYDRVTERIEWQGLRRVLLSMNEIFQRPMLHKTLELAGYYLDRFARMLPSAVFVYIERKPEEVARSIARARLRHHGDLSVWWGSYPREYPLLKDQPFGRQIAGQIHHLLEMYREKVSLIDSARVVEVSYEDLCHAPRDLLNRVGRAVRETSGFELRRLSEPPLLEPSDGPDLESEVQAEILTGLRDYNLI